MGTTRKIDVIDIFNLSNGDTFIVGMIDVTSPPINSGNWHLYANNIKHTTIEILGEVLSNDRLIEKNKRRITVSTRQHVSKDLLSNSNVIVLEEVELHNS